MNEIAAAGNVPVTLPEPGVDRRLQRDQARRRRWSRARLRAVLSTSLTYFASSQFSPTPTSTTSGGSSSYAASISRLHELADACVDLVLPGPRTAARRGSSAPAASSRPASRSARVAARPSRS